MVVTQITSRCLDIVIRAWHDECMNRNIIKRTALTIGVLAALADTTALASSEALGAPAHIKVTAHAVVVHSNLAHCQVEDASSGPLPCTWNIGSPRDGNGKGLSYWVGFYGNIHYVWDGSPVKGHPARHWVSSELADALAEGSSSHRPWERCWEGSLEVIHCPDGSTHRN